MEAFAAMTAAINEIGDKVDSETLAVELIEEVGTAPASFMHLAHTRKHWMKDRFMPLVADTDPHAEWVRKGKVDLLERAKAKCEEILATHRPAPLSEAQEQHVEAVLAEARAYYRKNGLITEEQWGPYMQALRESRVNVRA